MKTGIIFFIMLLLSVGAVAQNDTVIYFGVNGEMNPGGNAEIKKEIDYRRAGRVKVTTWKKTDNDWKEVYTEKIARINDQQYDIELKGSNFTEELVRRFEKQDDGRYKFTDWMENQVRRTGYTLSRIPLIFDGEVTEYYKSGNRKSVSVYENNRLQSSENWLEDGTEYIDNVYYSVDREPRYEPGMNVLHHFITQAFKKSEAEYSKLDGRLVVGFVVMEDGTIDGIRIEEGLNWQVNTIAVNAFRDLPGSWQPARIGDREVRYYQLFPINFIHHNYDFDYIDLRGSMLYWEIN